ncbi:hypothetical protein MAR_002392 [Mya arenaria]|uniref:Uncharacterized protein n=1 Tax=Mya arenaria TaxID=6604 RepID=A0ABY7FI48_MYAAR|nr:hypothetical protein MAR_002392 [Mya arenaria]
MLRRVGEKTTLGLMSETIAFIQNKQQTPAEKQISFQKEINKIINESLDIPTFVQHFTVKSPTVSLQCPICIGTFNCLIICRWWRWRVINKMNILKLLGPWTFCGIWTLRQPIFYARSLDILWFILLATQCTIQNCSIWDLHIT